MIYFDTETCGLHGLPIIIQYAEDDGEIIIYNFWTHYVSESIALIEYVTSQPVCAFNIAFDWFHLCKMYTLLLLVQEKYGDVHLDEVDPTELAKLEKEARDGPCLKPAAACDLMLHARKGPYQGTMNRSDIKIKRVPSTIVYKLANYLEESIDLKDIYFARRKDGKTNKWHVDDIIDEDDKIDPDFKNLTLRFKPSSALKALAVDALGLDVTHFDEIGVHKKLYPEEVGWAPFALALPGHGTWPYLIKYHIEHWEYNAKARSYASDDVDYLRRLYDYFGHPQVGDDDSELACCVAATRWKGFAIDIPRITELRKDATHRMSLAPRDPRKVKDYIFPHLSEDERLIIGDSTKRVILEKIRDWKDHPAAQKAADVLNARFAKKEVELYDKLLQAGRFHASFRVIGTLSSRMSGTDGLNPQGIKSTKEVRGSFPLAFEGETLSGGDFESFEVGICCAVYPDSKLEEDLNTVNVCADCKGSGETKSGGICSGCDGLGKSKQKIHALFAEVLYPDEDYESIVMSKGEEFDMYTRGKQGVFSQMYFGNEYTLQTRLGIGEDEAIKASDRWKRRYRELQKGQRKVIEDFTCVKQPGGLGTKVIWVEPEDYVETLLGFRRYFTLENAICKALFKLGENPPKEWITKGKKIVRRDREQTDLGAMRSAIFGTIFAIQGANVRAAGNHRIQGTGSGVCKRLQRKIWDLQPVGANSWRVRPMNIHDEIMVARQDDVKAELNQVVKDLVDEYKDLIPMISIDWADELQTWADK